jgi:hypothetical protein
VRAFDRGVLLGERGVRVGDGAGLVVHRISFQGWTILGYPLGACSGTYPH